MHLKIMKEITMRQFKNTLWNIPYNFTDINKVESQVVDRYHKYLRKHPEHMIYYMKRAKFYDEKIIVAYESKMGELKEEMGLDD